MWFCLYVVAWTSSLGGKHKEIVDSLALTSHGWMALHDILLYIFKRKVTYVKIASFLSMVETSWFVFTLTKYRLSFGGYKKSSRHHMPWLFFFECLIKTSSKSEVGNPYCACMWDLSSLGGDLNSLTGCMNADYSLLLGAARWQLRMIVAAKEVTTLIINLHLTMNGYLQFLLLP